MDNSNFKSQSGEDKYLYEKFFSRKKNGKYIELGAMAGVEYSNTYFFERELGWGGVLIEPNIYNFELLKQNRPNNFLFNELISNKNDPLTFRLFKNAMSAVSGVEESLSQHHLETFFDTDKYCREKLHNTANSKCICWWNSKQPQERQILKPKSLTEILQQTKITKFDFLSLDVEGHEFEVLQSYDFSIPIDVILIEMLGVQKEKDDMCRKRLLENDYIFHSTCAHNEVYIHKSFFVCNNLKIMRLGFTEGTSLVYWYMNYKSSQKIVNKQTINWLLSTSGFYDKEITGSYFDFSYEECIKVFNSYVFNEYMQNLYNGLLNCDKIAICLHYHNSDHICKNNCSWHYSETCKCNGNCNIFLGTCPLNYGSILNTLVNDIKPRNKDCLEIDDIHKLMENKKVLVMSSFAKLMKQQVLSGNCSKIYANFPKNVSIVPFETEYTFFNKGKDNNILETLERYKIDIQNMVFDLAIVSCGAYTHLLVPFIADKMHKDAITSFATIITDAFGIITKRSNKQDDFWIKIPNEYKPEDYLKIEEGCYW